MSAPEKTQRRSLLRRITRTMIVVVVAYFAVAYLVMPQLW